MKILIIRKKLLILVVTIAIVGSSCDVIEPAHSIYTPATFYTSESAILSSLSGVYRNLAQFPREASHHVLIMCTDEGIIHGKIQGWWDSPQFHNPKLHLWDEAHGDLNGLWNRFFGIVGITNALIESFQSSGLDNLEGPIAELRALRGHSYFMLMDMFGNVPIFTEPKVNPLNLPEQNTRAQVFDFVVTELAEAAQALPSQTAVGSSYYGRWTREAVYGLLAITYLNAEVWTGTAQYDQAITYANMVINSGAYTLMNDYFANFAHDNDNIAETLFATVQTAGVPGAVGSIWNLKALPGIDGGLFGMPVVPQNGYSSTPTAVARYEAQDIRRNMFFVPGEPFLDPRTGEQVMVERIVPDGNSMLYRPGISTEGPVPYELIPADGHRNQPMNAGIFWLKWGLDPNMAGNGAQNNDIALIRYADILLVKAEALLRSGGSATDALLLVNQVRERSNASTLNSITLDDILDERGRELIFEYSRRRDLIRFSKFTEPWDYGKVVSEEFRNLFPIPRNARNANPKLAQNPGY